MVLDVVNTLDAVGVLDGGQVSPGLEGLCTEPVIFCPIARDGEAESLQYAAYLARVAEPGVCMRLLERPRLDFCACWFDTDMASHRVREFQRLLAGYERGAVLHARVVEVNGCVLYVVYGRRVGTALLTHDFPDWVNFVYPIGDEKVEDFVPRIAGAFHRSNVELLDGFTVEDVLLNGKGDNDVDGFSMARGIPVTEETCRVDSTLPCTYYQ